MKCLEYAGKAKEFLGRWRGTALRAVLCAFVFWAFLWGRVVFPLQPAVVLAFATMLGLLVAFELLLRDAPQAWMLGSILAIDLVVGASYLLWRQLQPPAPSGPLVAADDPTPAGCGDTPGPGDLLMAFGTDRVLGKGPGPFTPILVDGILDANAPIAGLKIQYRAGKAPWKIYRGPIAVQGPVALRSLSPQGDRASRTVIIN